MEKLRSEIEEQYKWDLKVLYESDEEWLKDFEEVSKNIQDVLKFKGHLLDSGKSLLEALNYNVAVERKLMKLYFYAHLNSDADTSNTKYLEFQSKIELLFTTFSTYTAYFEPELLKADYSLIEKYMEEVKELKEFEVVLKDAFRFKDHVLDENEEKILSSLSKSLDFNEDIYSKLTDADMEFGYIKDGDSDVLLTSSNYSVYISSNNRETRKQAFDRMYETYSKVINTISTTLYGNTLTKSTLAKLRKYNSTIEGALFPDKVSKSTYENLIKTTRDNLDVLYKYYDLKKECLNLDELHLYDVYAKLVPEAKKHYSFDEARDIVLEALKPLVEEYVEDASKAFSERWIDIYPNKGKRSGAYSSGGYDTYPYLLLNYEGELNDVSTLAHELGHSMHTYYSVKNNNYQNSNYPIIVAEIASTVNELLLSKYLLKNSTDKNEKLSILNDLMDLFKGTIFRQTMFAEFEKKIYDLVDADEVLTRDNLCDIYYNLNKDYFGPGVIIDDAIKYEWARIPHFYYTFYVYKYATSLAIACYVVNNLDNEEFRSKYLNFLKLGGSMDPLDEIKTLGIDLEKDEVVKNAIKIFDDTINEFKLLGGKDE